MMDDLTIMDELWELEDLDAEQEEIRAVCRAYNKPMPSEVYDIIRWEIKWSLTEYCEDDEDDEFEDEWGDEYDEV